jgi:hypothetical protein
VRYLEKVENLMSGIQISKSLNRKITILGTQRDQRPPILMRLICDTGEHREEKDLIVDSSSPQSDSKSKNPVLMPYYYRAGYWLNYLTEIIFTEVLYRYGISVTKAEEKGFTALFFSSENVSVENTSIKSKSSIPFTSPSIYTSSILSSLPPDLGILLPWIPSQTEILTSDNSHRYGKYLGDYIHVLVLQNFGLFQSTSNYSPSISFSSVLLAFVGLACFNLSYLDLSFSSFISYQTLVTILKSCLKLKTLILKNTNLSDGRTRKKLEKGKEGNVEEWEEKFNDLVKQNKVVVYWN